MRKNTCDFMIGCLAVASINANAISLQAQLIEYEFLTINQEQSEKLQKIEKELHKLIQEITKS